MNHGRPYYKQEANTLLHFGGLIQALNLHETCSKTVSFVKQNQLKSDTTTQLSSTTFQMDLYHGLELPNAENRPILAEKIAPVRPSSNPVVNTTPNNSTSKRKRLTEDFDLEVSLNKLQRCMVRAYTLEYNI